jgi:hypothetical protein
MNTYPGYSAIPVLKEGVQLLQAVKFPALEGIVLEIAPTTLDDALLLGMAWSTGKRDKTPVSGKGGIKLTDIGVIEAGTGNTGLKVIESDNTGHPTEIKKGILVGAHESHLVLPPQRLFIAVTAAR